LEYWAYDLEFWAKRYSEGVKLNFALKELLKCAISLNAHLNEISEIDESEIFKSFEAFSSRLSLM
jgi:hypothetical protein